MKTSLEQNFLFLYIYFGLILFLYWLVQNFMYKNRTLILIFLSLFLKITYQKKCEKCLEAENIPLTDLLFYILEVLDPCSYKSSHLAM